MNERIKELAELAYEHAPLMVANPETCEIEHKVGNGGVFMYNRVFNQEKFAELIIKDCIRVPYAMWDKAELNADVAVKIEARIKDHFGVEE